MIDLKQMRALITPSCKPVKNSIFGFEIDIKKLEEELNNNSDFHVIAACPDKNGNIRSRVPNVNDIPLLSEFILKKGQLEEILNGQNEFIILTLYSDKDGTYVVKDHNKEIPADELFEKLNNPESDKFDLKLIGRLASVLPSYRILIEKKFEQKKDKLIYSTRIRYNKAAVEYINANASEESVESTEETNAPTETTEEINPAPAE